VLQRADPDDLPLVTDDLQLAARNFGLPGDCRPGRRPERPARQTEAG